MERNEEGIKPVEDICHATTVSPVNRVTLGPLTTSYALGLCKLPSSADPMLALASLRFSRSIISGGKWCAAVLGMSMRRTRIQQNDVYLRRSECAGPGKLLLQLHISRGVAPLADRHDMEGSHRRDPFSNHAHLLSTSVDHRRLCAICNAPSDLVHAVIVPTDAFSAVHRTSSLLCDPPSSRKQPHAKLRDVHAKSSLCAFNDEDMRVAEVAVAVSS
jgi:hypothetical protein